MLKCRCLRIATTHGARLELGNFFIAAANWCFATQKGRSFLAGYIPIQRCGWTDNGVTTARSFITSQAGKRVRSSLKLSDSHLQSGARTAWYTYIDPNKTSKIAALRDYPKLGIRQGERIVGFCYRKAGWKPMVTKDGKPRLSNAGQWLLVKLNRYRAA